MEWNSGNVEVLKVVSKALTTIGDHENVIRVNEEIVKIAPSDVNAYLSSATAKIGLGKYQEASNELLALEKDLKLTGHFLQNKHQPTTNQIHI